METKETNFSKEKQTENSKILSSIKVAPRSVRPLKSMMRVESFKPRRMSIARQVVIKKK